MRFVDLVEKPCCGRSLTEPHRRPKVSNLPGDLRSGVSAGSGDPRRTRPSGVGGHLSTKRYVPFSAEENEPHCRPSAGILTLGFSETYI